VEELDFLFIRANVVRLILGEAVELAWVVVQGVVPLF
jgi:hypothetical protein